MFALTDSFYIAWKSRTIAENPDSFLDATTGWYDTFPIINRSWVPLGDADFFGIQQPPQHGKYFTGIP